MEILVAATSMEDLKAAIVCGIILCLVLNAAASPAVQISNSRIVGQRLTFLGHEVIEFLGVPYALPPLGSLRFQRPVPIQNYPKVFKAFRNPPSCPQFTSSQFPWYVNSGEKSEDCLYMNFWVPADASPKKQKAVMFFMYGGGYRYGGINDPIYNGQTLSALGDIIVVTINYRLGFFGFLTSNSTEAPGNAGLFDVLEGLRWVNKNIAAFGGDVSRITISGESAGAINAGLLTITPLAEGLYTRIIMESASPAYRNGDNNTQNLAFSQQLATYVGCANASFTIDAHPKQVVQCLQGISAEKLSRAQYEMAPNASSGVIPEFGNEFLKENPRISISKGDFRCTDLLIGGNSDEGSYQLTVYLNQTLFGFFGENNPHIDRTLGEKYLQQILKSFSSQDRESIMKYYLPENLTEDTDYQIRRQIYTALGDTVLLCPTVYYADKCSEQGNNVYFYFFTHRPSISPWAPWMGTTHFEEVQFVFGQPILNPQKYKSSEVILSRELIDIWSNFVKYGNPRIPWPLYSRKKPAFKYLGLKDAALKDGLNGPHASNCNFLRTFYGF